MTLTTIKQKAEGALVGIYNAISRKFKKIITKPKEWFPIIKRYPVLAYAVIPLFIGLIFLLRYVIKLFLNEFASWSSELLNKTSGYSISAGNIMMALLAVFIVLRILIMSRKHRSKKNKTELNTDES